MPVFFSIKSLILQLHILYLHSYTLVAPTHPLYYTVALDSRSEAKYVRRQDRGLGI